MEESQDISQQSEDIPVKPPHQEGTGSFRLCHFARESFCPGLFHPGSFRP